ncbi:MAG: chromate transporter [Nitrospirales bacterium]
MNQTEVPSLAGPPSLPLPVTLGQASVFWLKLGFISFGGPAGQIAIMHQELVERRHWISERRFLHALNYCMVLPGPEAQQLATYIGWLMHRTWGGIVAGALFVLPSLLILIVLSWIYIAFGDVPLVAGLFYGIKPAVTAIVVQAAQRIGSRALKNKVLWAIALRPLSPFLHSMCHSPPSSSLLPLSVTSAGGSLPTRLKPVAVTTNPASWLGRLSLTTIPRHPCMPTFVGRNCSRSLSSEWCSGLFRWHG